LLAVLGKLRRHQPVEERTSVRNAGGRDFCGHRVLTVVQEVFERPALHRAIPGHRDERWKALGCDRIQLKERCHPRHAQDLVGVVEQAREVGGKAASQGVKLRKRGYHLAGVVPLG
jgi:hypothetical protein